ncbi:MAG: group III truncated hemoglobin [Pyrinomonadaceae bacterium]
MITSPTQLPDIQDREDITRLLEDFYKRATADDEIGHHFISLDLESHIPVIANFWEKILLGNPVYFGNPFDVHKRIHERSPITAQHFNRWVTIFRETLDSLFSGQVADLAKERAGMIANSLSMRI